MKHLNLPKEFTVDCNTWCRGDKRPLTGSKLLTEQGTYCCLGFLSKACGVPDEKLLNKNYPSTLAVQERIMLDKLVSYGDTNSVRYTNDGMWFNTLICSNIAVENDNKNINDKLRMNILQKLFKQIDVEIKFINIPLVEPRPC